MEAGERHSQSGGSQALPIPDLRGEAARICAAADRESIDVRVAGGLGIALRCPSASHEPLRRSYGDIDVVGRGRDRKRIVELFASLGYIPDQQFNAVHGAHRLYFWDSVNERHIDVFLDKLVMCHTIDLASRLQLDGPALTPADLLLLKLQIVEANAKDLSDVVTLLVDHPLTEDEQGINIAYLRDLISRDWGVWRTTSMIAERTAEFASPLDLPAARFSVAEQVGTLLDNMTQAPKSRAWKLRAKIGDRKRWYELPEEETHE